MLSLFEHKIVYIIRKEKKLTEKHHSCMLTSSILIMDHQTAGSIQLTTRHGKLVYRWLTTINYEILHTENLAVDVVIITIQFQFLETIECNRKFKKLNPKKFVVFAYSSL